MQKYYILKDDEVVAVDLLTWAKWFETEDRKIKHTVIGNYSISTVFLGCDHSYGNDVLMLFETMVFDKDRCPINFDSLTEVQMASISLLGHDLFGCNRRYATLDGARDGHEEVVNKMKVLIQEMNNGEKCEGQG